MNPSNILCSECGSQLRDLPRPHCERNDVCRSCVSCRLRSAGMRESATNARPFQSSREFDRILDRQCPQYVEVFNPPGCTGPQGPTGPQGVDGPTGPKGDVGPAGPQGAEGIRGPKGSIGEEGPQGCKGEVGPTGPYGPVGPRGPVGPQGREGPTGPRGRNGPCGDRGPRGPQGFQGATGHIGPTGAQGATGSTGPPGLRAPDVTQILLRIVDSNLIPDSPGLSFVSASSPGPNTEVYRLQLTAGEQTYAAYSTVVNTSTARVIVDVDFYGLRTAAPPEIGAVLTVIGGVPERMTMTIYGPGAGQIPSFASVTGNPVLATMEDTTQYDLALSNQSTILLTVYWS